MFCEVLPSHLHIRDSSSHSQCHQKASDPSEARAGAQEELPLREGIRTAPAKLSKPRPRKPSMRLRPVNPQPRYLRWRATSTRNHRHPQRTTPHPMMRLRPLRRRKMAPKPRPALPCSASGVLRAQSRPQGLRRPQSDAAPQSKGKKQRPSPCSLAGGARRSEQRSRRSS
jgi:hypothetical protein